ncbi:MAG: 3-phosphoshikimate 1-carboxyvinyltransferase [Gammaproteobacteria bacterium]
MEHLDLAPIRRVSGTVRLPGSKSISNRILLLAALAEGTTRILDPLDSDDTRYMLDALRKLGVALSVSGDGKQVEVQGTGGRWPARSADLYLGNAGTAFRPLTAALAFAGGEYKLSGLPRMHERPIKDLVDALRRLGARIDYLGTQGYPPLAIHPPTPSVADDVARVSIRGDVSSQFVTALLMALPLRSQAAEVTIEGELISRPYVHITLNMMKRFGVTVMEEGANLFRIPAGACYVSPAEISVEGDASSASYFLTAGVISGLSGGGPVRVEGVGRDSIQGDVALVQALESMGASIEMGPHWISATANAEARRAGTLRPIDADLNHIPDAAMVLAVAALFADGPSTLRNIGSWRVKETDRIAAMATELRKLGAVATEGPDWLRVEPPAKLRDGAAIDTYEDHRIAMSFSLAALGGVTVRINDPGCVAKTFPDYFPVFGSISV